MNGYNDEWMNDEAQSLCRICNKPRADFHHCIFKRMKRFPELNSPENLMPVCKDGHNLLESMGYEGRCWCWKVQCIIFGEEHMMEWWESLPMKYKERFW